MVTDASDASAQLTTEDAGPSTSITGTSMAEDANTHSQPTEETGPSTDTSRAEEGDTQHHENTCKHFPGNVNNFMTVENLRKFPSCDFPQAELVEMVLKQPKLKPFLDTVYQKCEHICTKASKTSADCTNAFTELYTYTTTPAFVDTTNDLYSTCTSTVTYDQNKLALRMVWKCYEQILNEKDMQVVNKQMETIQGDAETTLMSYQKCLIF